MTAPDILADGWECHAPRERVSWNRSEIGDRQRCQVTLHVSVWVEISSLSFAVWVFKSRSTWACELKCTINNLIAEKIHVTLHVSVWVEIVLRCSLITATACHAPRERVSWNFGLDFLVSLMFCHAPRERVSWNLTVRLSSRLQNVTLHVSVWVEILWK